MNKLRITGVLLAAASLTIALSGCSVAALSAAVGAPSQAVAKPAPRDVVDTNDVHESVGTAPDTTVFNQKLPDGRTVLCVSAREYHGYLSLSCDWVSAGRLPVAVPAG